MGNYRLYCDSTAKLFQLDQHNLPPPFGALESRSRAPHGPHFAAPGLNFEMACYWVHHRRHPVLTWGPPNDPQKASETPAGSSPAAPSTGATSPAR